MICIGIAFFVLENCVPKEVKTQGLKHYVVDFWEGKAPPSDTQKTNSASTWNH